jgi:hypothetical protein
MLAASGQAAYISEPLNLLHRPGVFRFPVRTWYPYICLENQAEYLPALLETINFRYHLWAEICSLRSLKDVQRMGRDWWIFTRGRLFRQRPLIKDPFAVFSIPWFMQALGCQAVVTVRHPAGFSSSLKRLNWPFDFNHLLEQPLLMQDWLSPWKAEMRAMLAHPDDIIGQASLLWCMVYQIVSEMRKTNPALQVVRHEDLSLEPLQGFENLYRTLGLSFSSRVQRTILSSSSSDNPKEVPRNSIYHVRLDSRENLHNWKRRLSSQEIDRIRALTWDVAASYYPDEDWG